MPGPSTGRPVFGALPQRPQEQLVETDVDETARVLGWRATTGRASSKRSEWYRGGIAGGARFGHRRTRFGGCACAPWVRLSADLV